MKALLSVVLLCLSFTAQAQSVSEFIALGVKEEARYKEYIVTTKIEYDGGVFSGGRREIELEGVLIKPDPERFKPPYPLVVFNHGSQPYRSNDNVIAFDGGSSGNRTFIHAWTVQGFAYFAPIRKGFLRRGGPTSTINVNTSEPIICGNRASQVDGLKSAKEDTMSLVRALSSQHTDIDYGKIIMTGRSRGGIVALDMAADAYPGITAVVNWVGRWHWEPCPEGSSFNSDLFKKFGEQIKVPVISFYGDKDPEHTTSYIESHMKLLNVNPAAKTVYFPGADHVTPLYVRNWFTPMRSFLEEVLKK